jgi:putative inorganic carbon (HCO3(-)) transporter
MTSVALRRPPARAKPPDAKSAPARASWPFEWFYFSFVMLAWCFTPLLRRLNDWHNGFFNPVQLASTIPFVLTIPLALIALRPERLARLTPAFKAFACVWLATFGYGMLLAILVGNMAAGLFESIQYLVPMLAGIWLAGSDLDNSELMRRLSRIVLPIATVVGVYGLVQFVQPAPWDVLWIEGGKFTSMGDPVPFGLRIFSTLNSTGPAADFFAICIVFSLPFCRVRNLWIWPLIALLGSVLLLTLVREAWVGLIVGVAIYLAVSPARFRVLPFLALYGIVFSVLISSLPAFLGAGQNSDVITSRISSLGDVSHDESALARTSEIQVAIQQALANPFGSGLGQIGSSAALSANPASASGNVLDSGYLARLLELGWLGFAGYLFVVMGGFVAMLVGIIRAATDPRKTMSREHLIWTSAAVAICAAFMWSDAAGDAHLGLSGLFFWIAMGFGMHRPANALQTQEDRLRKTTLHRKLRPVSASARR